MNTALSEVTIAEIHSLVCALRDDVARQEKLLMCLFEHLEVPLADAHLQISQSHVWVPKKSNSIAVDVNDENFNVRSIEQVQRISQNNLDRLKVSWVGKFYINHVKRYPVLRKLIIWTWRNFYPIYVNRVASYSRNKTSNRWRQLIKLSELDAAKVISKTQLVDAVRVETPIPQVIPVSDQNYLVSPHAHYNFPSIYVTTINDGVIYGGTNFVLTKDEVICHDLYDFERDYTSEEMHGRNLINAGKRRIRWLLHDGAPKILSSGATFVDACAPNYAHWLTEVLPRIAIFCAEEKFSHVPIVVNDGLHKNLMESLFLVAGSNREIITLPIGRALQVQELFITSVTGYVPFERRNYKLPDHSHGMFSSHGFNIIRNKVASLLAENELEQDWPEKIYLRRNSGMRKVANAKELEKLLVEFGFVIVEPEKLTFLEQCQLFSHAKVIIGSSGAALANIIFTSPETKIYIMISKYPETSYWYWQNIACASGKKVRYVLGEMVDGMSGIHSDFTVDLNDISKELL